MMASPGNQHCASCIGTFSFPIPIGSPIPMVVCHSQRSPCRAAPSALIRV